MPSSGSSSVVRWVEAQRTVTSAAPFASGHWGHARARRGGHVLAGSCPSTRKSGQPPYHPRRSEHTAVPLSWTAMRSPRGVGWHGTCAGHLSPKVPWRTLRLGDGGRCRGWCWPQPHRPPFVWEKVRALEFDGVKGPRGLARKILTSVCAAAKPPPPPHPQALW